MTSRRKPIQTGLSHRGHVVRLDPTFKQANALARAAGASRFTYNWALAEWDRQYKAGERPNASDLRKQFNAIKSKQFPWIYESPRDANSQPFADLGQAFMGFFDSCSGKRKGPKVGYPTFRRRGVDDSFYVANDRFWVKPRGKRGVVKLPVIGNVRMQEALRLRGKIMSGRVYRRAGRWYIAINVEADAREVPAPVRAVVGIDLGLKRAVTASQGTVSDAPKPLKKALKRLARAGREFSRKVKGSKNREEARMKVARIHQRIANIRQDFWQKLTTQLCRENQTVVIEDLGMAFMMKNRSLSRAASDVALGMFRPMMEYKSIAYGCELVVANKFFPSTQRCSGCGYMKTGNERMMLGESVYRCGKCGTVKDRDENASDNLEQYSTQRLAGNWGYEARMPAETTPLLDGTSSKHGRGCGN